MKIALGSDHGGFELKETLKKHLEENGTEVKDTGAFECGSSDYPDFAAPVCDAVLSNEADFGILLCGTGIGMSMAANKIRGIRCALLCDVFSARAAAQHNDANVIALGGRVTGPGLAIDIVEAFLSASFSGEERHLRRIKKVMDLEKR